MPANMPATVHITSLPGHSELNARMAPGDFLDCYCVRADIPAREAAEIITAFPAWVQWLVRLRGVLVAPFGLSRTGPDAPDRIGLFPVEQDTPEEVIAGFNDRHLDFRIAVLSRDGEVSLATWVRRHNLGGRLYLGLIMPFHVLVARDALARVAGPRRAGTGSSPGAT